MGYMKDSTGRRLDSFAPLGIDKSGLISQLTTAAQFERSVSLSNATIALADAVKFSEPWTNLTAWTAGSPTVSGGKLLPSTSGTQGLNYGFASTTESVRVSGTVEVVAGGTGTSPGMLIGFSKTAAGAAFVSGDLFAIGIGQDGTPIKYDAGTNILNATVLPPGTYYVSCTADATNILLTITNATGTISYSAGRLRSGFAPNNITVFASDSRGASGNKIGPLTARKGAVPIEVRNSTENKLPSLKGATDTNAQAIRVTLPTNYDHRRPSPVVLGTHGNAGDEAWLTADAGVQSLYDALLAAGYIVATSFQHGNNWGSPTATTDIVTLYKYVRDNYSIGPVVMLGQSMGGLSSLSAITRAKLPIAGWAGLYPVCDLRWMYDNIDGPAIRTAYGIAGNGSDYAAKTAGYNPMLEGAEAYRGLPMRFYASPADTRVPKVNHTDLLAAKVAPYAKESTVIVCSGAHGDASHYQPSDLTAFFARCISTV